MSNPEDVEEIKAWRRNWLTLIFEFAHLDYQKGLWLEMRFPGIIGSFGEDVCQYFDDLYLDDHYQTHLRDGTITQNEFEAVKAFHFAFDEYVAISNKANFTFGEREILADPRWLHVVRLGKEAWNHLKEILTDSEEKAFMLSLEHNYLYR